MTFDATWGASTANAYCTVDEADTHIEETKFDYANWTAATSAQRAAAIRLATVDIDSRNWKGYRMYTYQNLEFPRTAPGEETFPWGQSTISAEEENAWRLRMRTRVKEACAMQAFYIVDTLDGTFDEHRTNQLRGIINYSESVGPLSESFSYGGVGSRLCPEASGWLKAYKGQTRLARG